MKKFVVILIVLFLGSFCFSNVFARGLNESMAEDLVQEFISCINDGDECAYNFVDKTNEVMMDGLEENLNAVSIRYYVKSVEKQDDNYYIVKLTINAEGPGWSTSGFTAVFDVKNVNGSATITNTTLFDHMGIEAVGKLIFKIFALVGVVLLSIFGIIIIGVVIAVVAAKRKKY